MIPRFRTLRSTALEIWELEIGTPYAWGGDDPLEGFDCSGFVIEGLKSVGKLPADGDWTAAGLAAHFQGKDVTRQQLKPGCLLFWQRGQKIGHVEIVWRTVQGVVLTLGASGGGSDTHTVEAAAEQNAYVKVRPARPNWVLALDPFR